MDPGTLPACDPVKYLSSRSTHGVSAYTRWEKKIRIRSSISGREEVSCVEKLVQHIVSPERVFKCPFIFPRWLIFPQITNLLEGGGDGMWGNRLVPGSEMARPICCLEHPRELPQLLCPMVISI